mgnify:CR=1 FL=1|tara:strand:- start:1084 stop:1557 length:474 start_codon:yes stop_codon:yes gene_type:complete
MEKRSPLQWFVAASHFISVPVMSLFYGYIGWKHLAEPKFFLDIMPSYIPLPEAAVWWSGLWEMSIAVFLLHPRTRRFSAWSTFVLLLVVSPVNINMCFDSEVCETLGFTKEDAILRLFFQIPLLCIALWHASSKKRTWQGLICSLLFYPTIFYFLTL